MANAVGAPGWVDLASSELGEVREFYTGLFGWRWLQRPDNNIAMIDKTPVAGLLPPESDFIPTAWTVYLECGTVRGSCEKVRALGGKVIVPPTATPGDETFLVAEDPTGAIVGLWEAPPHGRFGRDHAGMLCWAELHTRDGSTADPFYAELFGYRQEQIGQPGDGFDYTVWYVDEQPTVGRFETSLSLPENVPAHWLLYFQVNPDQSTDSAVERVQELGGKLVREPSDSPYGRMAMVQDVVGADFAIIDTSARTGE